MLIYFMIIILDFNFTSVIANKHLRELKFLAACLGNSFLLLIRSHRALLIEKRIPLFYLHQNRYHLDTTSMNQFPFTSSFIPYISRMYWFFNQVSRHA